MLASRLLIDRARRCLFAGALLLAAAAPSARAASSTRAPFGAGPKGEKVELFTLANDKGMSVKLINYGATIAGMEVPDRGGRAGDVVLGCKDLAGYLEQTSHIGAVVGRYGNRIANAEFTLDGVSYKLDANNGKNTLHGGKGGFEKVFWNAEPLDEAERVGVRFTYVSPDGDQGFPGQLTAKVTYWLTKSANELRIEYDAATTKPTVVNLTQHTYFNLLGEGSGTIAAHKLMLDAPFYLPVDAAAIPTGEVRSVSGTPFDFTKPMDIGSRIDPAADVRVGLLEARQNANLDEALEQLRLGKGYDHCFVLNKRQIGDMTLAAKLSEATSGRAMEVWTTEPGIQFYSGNNLNGKFIGRAGKPLAAREGVCLETEHFPDSPNKAYFPTAVLRPDREYHTETLYKFMIE